MNYMSANRDVEHFDSPDELDFERMGTPHVAFGVGFIVAWAHILRDYSWRSPMRSC